MPFFGGDSDVVVAGVGDSGVEVGPVGTSVVVVAAVGDYGITVEPVGNPVDQRLLLYRNLMKQVFDNALPEVVCLPSQIRPCFRRGCFQ